MSAARPITFGLASAYLQGVEDTCEVLIERGRALDLLAMDRGSVTQ